MIELTYDLHIHSCLSPCSNDDMTPQNIVAMSSLKDLDVIAITDHNSCKNCPALMNIAKEYNIVAIPGMELTTLEEVHVLCLFYTLDSALAFDNYVYDRILPIQNNANIFGHQILWDKSDKSVGEISKLLISSTDISIDNLWEILREFNGIMIPAHIDKTSTSIISNLGFIPPDSKFSCVELMDENNLHNLRQLNPYLNKCSVLYSSDAHTLGDISEPKQTISVSERSIQAVLDKLVMT
ncbi:MAG: PHP domain-containing protein [Aminipila sp.]